RARHVLVDPTRNRGADLVVGRRPVQRQAGRVIHSGIMVRAVAHGGGGITDEGVERLRARIGIAQPHPQPPHYRFPNEDAFRHVAESYGDDNPLWCDPDHARASVWGGPIAPPPLNGGDTLVGVNEVASLDADTRALL